jgi:hypothetical protein
VRSSSRHSTEPIGIERTCIRSMSQRHTDICQRANLHWRANMDRRRDLAAVRFASPRRGPVQCSEIAIGRDVAVTIESRSDPSYSRCQISRTRTDDARPFGPRGIMADAEDVFSANEHPDWWSQTGSNRRPPACKAGALPTELWPRKSSSPPSPRLRRATFVFAWLASRSCAAAKVGGPGKT